MQNFKEGVLKLKATTLVSHQGDNQLILLNERQTTPLRLSGYACMLVSKLRAGTTLIELETMMSAESPRESSLQIQRSLNRFMEKLSEYDLLEGEVKSGEQEQIDFGAEKGLSNKTLYIANPDKVANFLAVPFILLPKWLRGLLAVSVIAMAFVVLIYGAIEGKQSPAIPQSHYYYSLLGVLILPIWWVLHELGHALTCRLSGYPISKAGIRFRGWLIPSPFVDVRALLFSKNKWSKIWCALAGPYMDIIVMGTLMSLLVFLPDDELFNYSLRFALFLVCAGFIFNLTPWRQSDGMSALSHFFEDPLIMQRSLYSKLPQKDHRSLTCYKVIAWLYLTVVLVLFSLLIWQAYLFVESVIITYE